MQVLPGDIDPRAQYLLLTSLVVPRPIAWVSTLAADGTRNLAPHSYFNIVSADPPIVHVTSSGVKDTLTNVRASGEFVVNTVTLAQVEQMNVTAADFPPGEDEFTWAGLDAVPSAVVAPPRVAGAPAALECRVRAILSMGEGNMIFGDVVAIHVDDGVLADGRVDPVALAPVGRLMGSLYTTVDDVYRLDRPTWAQLRGDEGRP